MDNKQSPVGLNNYNIEDYAKKHVSADKSVDDITSNNDILILPYQYDTDYYFAEESVNFVKYCRQENKEIAIDVLGDDVPIRSLNSWDIWMPIIYIAEEVLLPVAVGLAINYLWDRIKGREKENPQVDITFRKRDGDKTKELHFKGGVDEFKEKFEKIDLNKW